MNETDLNSELKCVFCGKNAIGIQILGCTQQTVCSEHAEKILSDMNPGESRNWGDCYYVRY